MSIDIGAKRGAIIRAIKAHLLAINKGAYDPDKTAADYQITAANFDQFLLGIHLLLKRGNPPRDPPMDLGIPDLKPEVVRKWYAFTLSGLALEIAKLPIRGGDV